MSQHDYIISDAVGSVFLSDLNSNLQAIVTDNSGTTEPTVTYANMVWADTSTSPPTIKRRNALNTAWVSENDMSGNVTISTNNSSAALTITQVGAGNCLVVNDQYGDTKPFVINNGGNVGIGGPSPVHRLNVFGGNISADQTTGYKIAYNAGDVFTSSGGTSTARYGLTYNAMGSTSNVGLSGHGGLGFYTGDALRMSINNTGNVGINTASSGNSTLRIGGSLSGGTDVQGVLLDSTVYRTATGIGCGVITAIGTEAATFTTSIAHYTANQGTIGAGSTVTIQYGFIAAGTLTGATNNFGFYGDITSASGRYNFYASGTAPNYYAGDVRTNTTVTEATTVTNSNSSTTLTAANLLGHIVSGTPTAGINYTLPTGTGLDTAFQNLSNNQAFNWSVINLAAATHAITLLANTAHTIVGNAVVQANTSGTFRTRKTAANTFVTYRIS